MRESLIGVRLSVVATRAVVTCGVLAGCLGFSSPARAQIIFNFNYLAGQNDDGFQAPVVGAARQAALSAAGTLFSNYFGTLFSNSGIIDINVSSSQTPLPGTLASAGTFINLVPGFGLGEVVRNKLLGNGDINGASADGVVNVNFGAEWQLDPNIPAVGPGPGQTFDFFAAMNHELTHALGFSSFLSQAGTDPFGDGNAGTGNPGTWTKFDDFLKNSGGVDLINHGTGLTNQAVYDAAKTSAVTFNGANAVAAFGGPVPIFAPNPFQPGSSISHLNTNDPLFALAMMKHDRDYGPQEARTYSAVEIGIMTDLGYTRIAAIPEPGGLTLGFSLIVGLAVYRLKPRRAAA